MTKRILLVPVLALALAACQTAGPKQSAGALLGGVAGAIAGSQFGKGSGKVAAGALGALLGAAIGGDVGQSLDRADRLAMAQTTSRALETQVSGTQVAWRNPDSGNYGTVTPRPVYQDSAGQYCREFQQTVTVGGKTEEAYGTACRQPDGTWKIVR